MKLQKIKLNALASAELNEREMCRILGGGEPGCCQCGCNHADSGGSSTSSNDSANNAQGSTSDPGADPCPDPVETTKPTYPDAALCSNNDATWTQESTCPSSTASPSDPITTATT